MGVTHGVPASWWLEVASVHIPDASAGQPVRMAVQRTIRRDFVAEWSASVRTDDGAAQYPVPIKVYQIGAAVGRGAAATRAV